jgi:hypothetical protein
MHSLVQLLALLIHLFVLLSALELKLFTIKFGSLLLLQLCNLLGIHSLPMVHLFYQLKNMAFNLLSQDKS